MTDVSEARTVDWKDQTTYSPNTPEEDRKPTVWVADLGDLVSIMVHRHISYGPDNWLFTSKELNYQHVIMKSKRIEDAKEEAIIMAYRVLKKKIGDLKKELKILSTYLVDEDPS
jgi:hypothetical protein